MKILHIIRSCDPKAGGPIEGVTQLSKCYKELGHQLTVVTLDFDDADFVKNQTLFEVFALGSGKKSTYGYSKKLIPWLTLHCHEYDVIVINGIWQYHSFAAHRVLIKAKKPYYIFTHGMLDPWFKRAYPLKHLKKYLYWWWGEYPVLRDAKQVLFTCEEEKIQARESFWPYRCQEQVVSYGTAGCIGDQDLQKQLFLETYPQLQGKRYLLFLSRIHPKKGVDLLIEAFSKVYSTADDTLLVIAGPDQVGMQSNLTQLAERLGVAEKIVWPGMLSGDLKWGAYLNADAFVLPSHQENFGIVVAEALSANVPVLISNKVNIWREIVEDNAGLVANDDLVGCESLLSQWQHIDDVAKDNMRVNARVCFKNRYEITKASSFLLGLFEG